MFSDIENKQPLGIRTLSGVWGSWLFNSFNTNAWKNHPLTVKTASMNIVKISIFWRYFASRGDPISEKWVAQIERIFCKSVWAPTKAWSSLELGVTWHCVDNNSYAISRDRFGLCECRHMINKGDSKSEQYRCDYHCTYYRILSYPGGMHGAPACKRLPHWGLG